MEKEIDRATLPTEIEITPQMIEAGEDVLRQNVGAAINYNWDPQDLALQVYRAMYLCSGAPRR